MTMLEDLKRAAWARTNPVSGQLNAWEFRKDCLGNLVRYADFGNRHSPFGWELDYIISRARSAARPIPRTSRRCTGRPPPPAARAAVDVEEHRSTVATAAASRLSGPA